MKKFAFIIIALVIGVVTYATDFDVYKLDNGQTVVIQEVKRN
jgi:hypothetical protein